MRKVLLGSLLSLCAACNVPTEDLSGGDEQPSVVDHGDGTYSLELDASFDPGERVVKGAFVYEYVGQARYAYEGEAVSGPQTYVHDPKTLSPREQLMQTQVEDAEGRLWKLVDVGPVAARSADDERATMKEGAVEDAEPDRADADDLARDEVAEPARGDVLTWYPTSWDKRDCDGNGDQDWWIWDSDNRDVISSPSAPRQRTAVRITNSAGSCSGTILRDRWVLTAAHCTYNQNGTVASSYSVRNWANESVGVALVFRTGAYNYGSNGWDPEDDYVMLKLSASFP
ncbi:MAG: trypsin-like serine protease, partial [Myxococcales bacterium]|nr:trypsin-like serine protease [Myxococcales bacterium]